MQRIDPANEQTMEQGGAEKGDEADGRHGTVGPVAPSPHEHAGFERVRERLTAGVARSWPRSWQQSPPAYRIGVALGGALVLLLMVGLLAMLIGFATGGSVSQPSTKVPAVHVPAHQVYNAQPPAAPSGDTVELKLEAKEAFISIAPGVAYNAWTFNGTVPGPILRVRQGQTVHFTLTNSSSNVAHSIDFHAAQTPWNLNYQSVAPGKSFSFSWRANVPGVFMYHCGTPPVMMHIANGMYGAILVDPPGGWSPAREYVLVQSEFYLHQLPNGSYVMDNDKAMNSMPDYVVFNGYANQYKDAPLTAAPSEKIRLFIVNAGPSQFSAFHVIGAIFSDVYDDGDPYNHMHSSQTITIPPGGGTMVELTIPDSGTYPFVTHAFSHAMKGATGVIQVG
jgi:nitrite reductase (NO-forming)